MDIESERQRESSCLCIGGFLTLPSGQLRNKILSESLLRKCSHDQPVVLSDEPNGNFTAFLKVINI